MAANLDRAETSLTAVSDVAYIRAIDSSGNSVRISKADLASVLGVTSIAPRAIGGATDKYTEIFKFNAMPQGRVYPMYKINVFSSWGDTVIDEIVIGTNSNAWWGNVFHEEDGSKIKYYAVLENSTVHVYAYPIGTSNYHLVVGQVQIFGHQTFTWVLQNITEIPSDASEITTRVPAQ